MVLALVGALALPSGAVADRGEDAGTAGAAVTAMALRQIRADHGLAPLEPGDMGRIDAILAGQHLRDYEPRPLTGVAIIDARFGDPDLAQEGDLETLLRSAEGMRLLAAMSPDQIAALARLVQETRAAREPAAPPEVAPIDLTSGIPALGGMRPGSLAAPASLLLANWRLGRSEDGQPFMEDPDTPGSRLPLAEGLVVGALGSVSAIEDEVTTLTVRFSSGEVLKVEFPASATLPALAEEILVARRSDIPDTGEKPGPSQRPRARPSPDATSSGASSPRIPAGARTAPPPRPADLLATRTGD
jgi:hypothetical protein